MIIERKNLKGGRPLTDFPIEEDLQSGRLGRKIGYCAGCNEPLLIPMSVLREIGDKLVFSKYDIIEKRPRIPFKHRLIKRLGGEPKEKF